MKDMAIQQVLAQMRQMRIEAGYGTEATGQNQGADFGAALNESLQRVSELQQASSELKTAFENGDPGTDLAEVMIASQKARVSFEAVVQVRNRVVEAYQTIQRMSI
jgi:flagellar hook-basal body complex protein FliE